MKHTKKLLGATLLLTPALFAFSPRGTAIAFTIADGASHTKTFTNVAELSLDDMAMMMNGQESPMTPDIEMTVITNFSVTVTDEYLKMGAGRPLELKRSYDTIEQGTDLEMEIDIMGQVQSNDMQMPASSELEGSEVLFSWDGEAEAYKPSFPEGEGDEKLLEGLHEDMDLRAFLPAGDVSEGDEWKIEPQALIGVLAPGGNLKLIPEEMDSSEMMGMGNQEMGDFSDWFSSDMEGEVVATFKGTRETEDGAMVGVVSITIEITNAVDMTEMMQESMSELPEEVSEMEVTSMDLALELEGEATLLWDLAGGYMHSFEMTGDFAMQMDIAMDISAQGMDMEIEQALELSGSLTSTVAAE